jgi:hypothetical protein
MKPLHILTSYLLKINLLLYFHLRLGLPSDLFPLGFKTVTYEFVIALIHAIRSTHRPRFRVEYFAEYNCLSIQFSDILCMLFLLWRDTNCDTHIEQRFCSYINYGKGSQNL